MFCFRYFIDDSVLSRVPNVFFLLSGCYAAMQILATILLSSPPSVEAAINGERETLVKGDERYVLAVEILLDIVVVNVNDKAVYAMWFHV